MPHKRKRNAQAGKDDVSRTDQDLVGAAKTSGRLRRIDSKGSIRKPREEGVSRSLARVLASAQGFRPKSGLDEGNGKSKPTQKTEKTQSKAKDGGDTAVGAAEASVPKILPGERLADYSARVDAALPLQGRMRRGKGPAIPGLKQPRTKTERKMQKMQEEWRAEDAKIKQRRLEEADDLEDEMDDQLPGVFARHFNAGKKNALDDPWAVIAKSRAALGKSTGLVGIHDVVQAPPRLQPQRQVLHDGRKAKGVASLEV